MVLAFFDVSGSLAGCSHVTILRMSKWTTRALLAVILLLAAVLRLTGIDWDEYHHYHPDERYITWVATSIERPTVWQTALEPTQSTFNPYYWSPGAESRGIVVEQDTPRKFAYGHFPLYLGVAATRLVERLGPTLVPLLPPDWLFTRDILNGAGHIEFVHLTAVTRALTGLVDVATVWLLFLLGQRVYNSAVGLLAAAFLALNVMHIQLAHFFAFDPYMTLFVVAALYFMVVYADGGAGSGKRGAESGEPGTESGERRAGSGERKVTRQLANSPTHVLFLAAMCAGLAVGAKFAAVLLVLPLAVAVWLGSAKGREWRLISAVFIGVVAFMLTNPFAFLDFNCEAITPAIAFGPIDIPSLNWGSCFLENIGTQGAMVQGQSDLAFTRQYTGTIPYLYYIEMQLRWGMGLLLGLVAFIGFAYAIWCNLRSILHPSPDDQRSYTLHPLTDNRRLYILLSWSVPYFLVTGNFFVKFMRYLQPLTPLLMLFGAAVLLQWSHKWWRRAVVMLVLAVTGFYAFSFVNLYSQPHPWVAASRWVFNNIPAGTLILSEQWDDSLPSTMLVDGEQRRRGEYPNEVLTWHTGTESRDNEAKLARNLALLADAQYLTILSNRIYGVDPRLPERYPIASQYHQLLFDGRLGYEPVFIVGRTPMLWGIHLKPDLFSWPGLQPPANVAAYLDGLSGPEFGRVDESFIVYDQPLTIIFENKRRLSAEEMAQLFETK